MTVGLSRKAYFWLMAIHRGLDYDDEDEVVSVCLGECFDE